MQSNKRIDYHTFIVILFLVVWKNLWGISLGRSNVEVQLIILSNTKKRKVRYPRRNVMHYLYILQRFENIRKCPDFELISVSLQTGFLCFGLLMNYDKFIIN